MAELVCSNSLGSDLVDRAPGLLKAELRFLRSLILACADETSVPAGGALAVGREAFAETVTARVEHHPLIDVRREHLERIPERGIVVIATGPLTSPALAEQLASFAGEQHLYFYDAMAPIVTIDSVDMSKAFRASRYDRGEGDYINCPMDRSEYERFVEALVAAETIYLHSFEQENQRFFEGCLPVEVLARRGTEALAFGPLKPMGLIDPRTGKRPYAVVQLRQDNLAGTLSNLVGFQTNLKWPEQKRVFALIPGLENAEFVRFGQMHRNTFLNSPALLEPTMQSRTRPGLFFGGQITGTEGYIGSTGSGYVAGLNAARLALGQPVLAFPPVTMLGAICNYVARAEPSNFQPMKANFGLMPPLDDPRRRKRDRHQSFSQRAVEALRTFALDESVLPPQ
jgi:methylenetetrahydrofolate--tRNA-(uracil-5-)-methyltransferase